MTPWSSLNHSPSIGDVCSLRWDISSHRVAILCGVASKIC